MPTLTYTEHLVMATETCCNCGVLFGLPKDMQDRLRNSHKTFYCPSGHGQSYRGESDADRAQKLAGQLDIEKTRRENAEKAVRQAEITQKALSTKLRKTNARIKAGVCPCCNRTFQSLARHMTTKHPEFVAEGAAGV